MKENLTESELFFYLENLKQAIQEFDYASINNIIFYNINCFHHFINELQIDLDGNEYLVSDIMNLLEPYIPFTLDEQNLDLLISAITLPAEKYTDMQDYIIKKAKIDFIGTVINATEENEWNYVLNICNSMRYYKENNAVFV